MINQKNMNRMVKPLTLEDMDPYRSRFDDEDHEAMVSAASASAHDSAHEDDELSDDEMKKQALLMHIAKMKQASIVAQGQIKEQNEQSRLISERMRNF